MKKAMAQFGKVTHVPALCETCAKNSSRASMRLCEQCAKTHRVIALPTDVPTWEEIDKAAHGADGIGMFEYINGLMGRMFNQQRELAKLNARVRKS